MALLQQALAQRLLEVHWLAFESWAQSQRGLHRNRHTLMQTLPEIQEHKTDRKRGASAAAPLQGDQIIFNKGLPKQVCINKSI
jgi:hypothetical protein